ncbi:MAG: C-type lectin domain-containing protein [Pirellulales bacterium]
MRNGDVEARLAVRKNRIVLEVAGTPTVDFTFASTADLPSVQGDWGTPLGELFVYGMKGTRIARLAAGPPEMKMPSGPTPVNLAAAFEKAKHGLEGEFTASRDEIFVNGQPSKWSRLAFGPIRSRNYSLRLVIERRTGSEPFCLGVPIGGTRSGFLTNWSAEHALGVHTLNGVGADTNASTRRAGLLFMPGTQHVIDVDVRKDPKGNRLQVAIDGRTWLDHAGNDFTPSAETQSPNPRDLVISTYSSGWRIVRIDAQPEGNGRLPEPSSTDRTATETALRGVWAAADAKNAPLDGKLLIVDGLRKRAAEELDAPAVRYVVLDNALRIATEAGDLPGAFEAAEDLCSAFAVDAGAVRRRVLDVFKVARPQAPVKQKFIDDALVYMDRAARGKQFALAREMAEALERYLGTTAGDTRREVRARESEYQLWSSLQQRAAEATTSADGPDASNAASTAVAAKADGLYRCVALNDWASGTGLLVRGDDLLLSAAAQLEQGELKTGEQLQAAADKWWEASEAEKNPELKWALAERAAHWYRRATPLLSAKAKGQLERRKTQIAQLRKASNGAFGPRRPLDAVKIGEHWYKFYGSTLTWAMAERTCEELGGQLTTIESPAENNALTQYLLKSAGSQERASCWLGMSDTAQEGQFRLIDGTPLAPPLYTNWLAGQPDNGNGAEDVGTLDATFSAGQFTGVWADVNSAALLPFICEWDR